MKVLLAISLLLLQYTSYTNCSVITEVPKESTEELFKTKDNNFKKVIIPIFENLSENEQDYKIYPYNIWQDKITHKLENDDHINIKKPLAIIFTSYGSENKRNNETSPELKNNNRSDIKNRKSDKIDYHQNYYDRSYTPRIIEINKTDLVNLKSKENLSLATTSHDNVENFEKKDNINNRLAWDLPKGRHYHEIKEQGKTEKIDSKNDNSLKKEGLNKAVIYNNDPKIIKADSIEIEYKNLNKTYDLKEKAFKSQQNKTVNNLIYDLPTKPLNLDKYINSDKIPKNKFYNFTIRKDEPQFEIKEDIGKLNTSCIIKIHKINELRRKGKDSNLDKAEALDFIDIKECYYHVEKSINDLKMKLHAIENELIVLGIRNGDDKDLEKYSESPKKMYNLSFLFNKK